MFKSIWTHPDLARGAVAGVALERRKGREPSINVATALYIHCYDYYKSKFISKNLHAFSWRIRRALARCTIEWMWCLRMSPPCYRGHCKQDYYRHHWWRRRFFYLNHVSPYAKRGRRLSWTGVIDIERRSVTRTARCQMPTLPPRYLFRLSVPNEGIAFILVLTCALCNDFGMRPCAYWENSQILPNPDTITVCSRVIAQTECGVHLIPFAQRKRLGLPDVLARSQTALRKVFIA